MNVKNQISFLKTMVDYFYGIFMGNVLFLISNIPLLYLLYIILPPRSVEPSTMEIFLCLLPAGPAFTALLYSMNKVIREGDISVIRNYGKSYRRNVKQSLALWSSLLLFLVLLFVGVSGSRTAFYYLQLIGLVLLVFESLYVMAILSRFETTGTKAFMMAFYSIFSHFKETILLLFMMVFAMMVLVIYPSIGILFVFSGFASLVMIVLNNYLTQLEHL